MITCRKCGEKFPDMMIIDNKPRNLCNRKYCLECSPFNRHNTSNKLEYQRYPDEGTLIKCERCGRQYVYDRSRGHCGTVCNSCVTGQRRLERKQKMIDFKGGACQRCGYNKCNKALEFHHLDPSQKDMKISDSYNLSWEKIKLELNKCILICANCHRELHAAGSGN